MKAINLRAWVYMITAFGLVMTGSPSSAQNECNPIEGHYVEVQRRANSSYNALLSLINRLNVMNVQMEYRSRVYDARLSQAQLDAEQAEAFAQSADCSGIFASDADDCAFVLRSAGNRLRAAYMRYQREQLARERFLVAAQIAVQRQQARVAVEQQRYDESVSDREETKVALSHCLGSSPDEHTAPAPSETSDPAAPDVGETSNSTSSSVTTSLVTERRPFPKPVGM